MPDDSKSTDAPDTSSAGGGATSALAKKRKKPLGQRLLDAGLVSQQQLDLALREQKRLGIFLGEALESLGFVTQEVIASVLAQEIDADLVNVKGEVVPDELIGKIPYELAKQHKVLPLSHEGGTLTVAMVDTLNVLAVDALENLTGWNIDVMSAPEQDIMEAIEQNYAKAGTIEETMDQILQQQKSGVLEDEGEEAPTIRLVDQIITLAVKVGGTDIHVEPEEKVVRIRMRVDGVLRQDVIMPKQLQSAVTARFKIMANLNVTEKRIPQDGRISFMLGRRNIDLRLSTLPTIEGENIVIRVLDKENIEFKLSSLGFSPHDESAFEKALNQPFGIVLVTGPTGSGKTSTLYTGLSLIDTMQKSVFTLEDPVEYQLPIVRQTQINEKVGMTFAAGLRALLRQDPDVIMLGEIRDSETAEMAVRAALTGHLVLSTLHTNEAAAAIPRLIDMGLESFLLASSMVCIVGQRLVRRICPHCKFEMENSEAVLASLGVKIAMENLTLWDAKGCDQCTHSGYKGRVGIYEVIPIDHRMNDVIIKNASLEEIKKVARAMGAKTMFEDGLRKALKGITTVQEVMRVIK